MKCSVEGCVRDALSRGLCSAHYQRLMRSGTTGEPAIRDHRRNVGKTCSGIGCERAAKARGWCWKHYQRWSAHGDPEVVTVANPQHGTPNMYVNYGCRCDLCRIANTEHCRSRGIATYKKDLCACGNLKSVVSQKCRSCAITEHAVPHGTNGKYSGGCRCEECRIAASAAKRSWREANKVPCVSCGTLVERNTKKDPECKPCARARIIAQRRQKVAA